MITDKNFKELTILTGLPGDGLYLVRQSERILMIERRNMLVSDEEELMGKTETAIKNHPEINRLFRACIGVMTMATDKKGESTRLIAVSMIFDVVKVLEKARIKRKVILGGGVASVGDNGSRKP